MDHSLTKIPTKNQKDKAVYQQLSECIAKVERCTQGRQLTKEFRGVDSKRYARMAETVNDCIHRATIAIQDAPDGSYVNQELEKYTWYRLLHSLLQYLYVKARGEVMLFRKDSRDDSSVPFR